MHTYLELNEGVGIEPSNVVDPATGEEVENPRAGEPGPLRRQGIPYPVPVKTNDGEIVTQIQVLEIEPAEEISAIGLIPARIIPGTRIIDTTNDVIAAAILNIGTFHICDPPKSLAKARGKAAGGDKSTDGTEEV